jgi:tRNA methyltransferase complex GCD14 subunit
VLMPTPELYAAGGVAHRTQVVHTPDIAAILFNLDVTNGSVVIESGTKKTNKPHHNKQTTRTLHCCVLVRDLALKLVGTASLELLSSCVYVCHSVCISECLSCVALSVCLSLPLVFSLCGSLTLSLDVCMFLSVCLSVSLSVSLPDYLSLSLFSLPDTLSISLSSFRRIVSLTLLCFSLPVVYPLVHLCCYLPHV